MAKIACITGASSGFGKSCAEKFASNGYDLIITGRRADRLNELKAELEKNFGINVKVLVFDIRNKKATFDAVGTLDNSWKKINLLINNAGLALGRDYFDEADLEDWDTMIDTNVKGLLYITKALLPNLIETGNAHIINIGSTAGKEVYEKGNVYCASKFAVGALSEAMRIDLLRHGIKVTVIHPGAAETEFSLVRFKGDTAKAKAVYDGIKALSANDVADTVYYCASLPAHVCINELVLTCTQQANSFYLFKR